MRLALASAVAVAAALCAAGAGIASAASSGMGLYTGGTGLPLPAVESHVAVDVALGLARGEVRQQFRNTTGKVAEAVYVFPLPTGAAVTAMRITVAGTTIDAAIAPRAAAAARYEAAVADGHVAALTERERPGVYTQSVAGIPIGGVVEIALTWQARLERHAGVWELAHPMVVGPRYVPGTATGAPTRGAGWSADTDRAPDASRVTPPIGAGAHTPYTFAVTLTGVTALESPTHELAVVTTGAGTVAQVRDPRGDRELIVRWKSAADHGVRAIAEPATGGGGYVAVLIEAAPEPARPRRAARSWLVAIDRARSLDGVGAAQARRVAAAMLAEMRDDDRVAVVAIGQVPRFARATAAERARALVAFDRATGTDDLTAGLATTLAGLAVVPAPAVVLITDGLVADDAAAIARAAAAAVAIHTVGVGAAPNRWLLEAIAARTGGGAHVLGSPDQAAALAAEVIAADQAQPVTIDWRKPTVADAAPARAVVVPGGATLIVAVDHHAVPSGELEVAIGATRLRATIERRPGAALATEWARLRVAQLWAAGDLAGATALAIDRGVVGPTTALVAVGTDPGDAVRSTVTVAVPAPAGVRREARQRVGDDRDQVTTDGTTAGKKPAPKTDRGPTAPEKTTAPPVATPTTPKPAAPEPDTSSSGDAGGAAADDGLNTEAATTPEPMAPASDEDREVGRSFGEAISLSAGSVREETVAGRPLGRRWLTLGLAAGLRLDEPTAAASLALGLHQRVSARVTTAIRLDLTAAPTAADALAAAALLDLGLRTLPRLVLDAGVGVGWAGDLGVAYRAGLTFDAGRFGIGLHLTGVRSADRPQTTLGAGLETRF